MADVADIRHHGPEARNPAGISVVVVTYRADTKLRRCLESLSAQSSLPAELIVIDNSPEDTRLNELADFPVTYVAMRKNVGPSAGRNLGAMLASSRWLAFIDDDGYIDVNYLANAESRLQRMENVVCMRGRVLPEENAKARNMPHYDLGLNELPALPNTEGNLVIMRSAFIEAGGFENGLFGHEGLVLWYRMTRMYGHSLESFRYAPDLVLRHGFYRDKGQLGEKLLRYEWLHYWLSLSYPDMRHRMQYYDAKLRESSNPPAMTIGSVERAEATAAKKQFEAGLRQQEEKILKERMACQRERQSASGFEPDFSVIITCFNLGEYLNRALESVLKQTLRKFEVYIVDDASTDEHTIRVLDELGSVVPVIRKSRNEGVAAARNTGIDASRAPYICCLDADDFLHPTYLEKAKAHFRMDNEVGIVSSYLRLVGCESGSFNYPDYEVRDLVTDSPVHTASCFRRDACRGEPHYDSSLRGYEDWDHWIRIGKRGWRTVIIPEELFFYFRTPNSKVHTSHRNAAGLLARIIENHRELYEQHMVHVISTKHKDLSVARVALRQKAKECENLRQEIETLRREGADMTSSFSQTAKDAIVGENIDQEKLLTRIREGIPELGPVCRQSQHQSRTRNIPAKLRSLVISPPFLLAVVMSVIGSLAAWMYLDNPITAIAAIVAALYIAALICWNSQLNADRVEILQQQLSTLDAMIIEVDQRTHDSAAALYRDLGSLAVLSVQEVAKSGGLIQELAAASETMERRSRALADEQTKLLASDLEKGLAGLGARAEEQDRALANRLEEQSKLLASDLEKGLAGLGARAEEQDRALANRLEEQSKLLARDLEKGLAGLGAGAEELRVLLAEQAGALSGISSSSAAIIGEIEKLQSDGKQSRSHVDKALAQAVAEIGRLLQDGTFEKVVTGKLEAVSKSLQECIESISAQSAEQAQTAIALDRLNLEFRRQIAQFRKEVKVRDGRQ
jgi:glycosyltransferase involved in cell wall biosynthesis